MNFLIDTNVLIAVEPVRVDETERGLDLGAEFLALCATGGHWVFRHPHSTTDMTRDKDPVRLALRLRLATKYQTLGHPPVPPPEMVAVIGRPRPGSHDVVDHALLAAVMADAMDFLASGHLGSLRRPAWRTRPGSGHCGVSKQPPPVSTLLGAERAPGSTT